MDKNALGFASYWRNSLADAESGKGSFKRKPTATCSRFLSITSNSIKGLYKWSAWMKSPGI